MAKNSFPLPLVLLGIIILGLFIYMAWNVFNNPISYGDTKNEAEDSQNLGMGKPTNGTNSTPNIDPLDPINKPTIEQIRSVMSYKDWIKKYYYKFPIIGKLPKKEFMVINPIGGQLARASFFGAWHNFFSPTQWWPANTNEGAELRKNHLEDTVSKQKSLHNIHAGDRGSVVWTEGKDFYISFNNQLTGDSNQNLLIGWV